MIYKEPRSRLLMSVLNDYHPESVNPTEVDDELIMESEPMNPTENPTPQQATRKRPIFVARRGAPRTAQRVRRGRPERTGRNKDVFGPHLQTYESKIQKQRDSRSRSGGIRRRTHPGSKKYSDSLSNISSRT